MVFFSLLLNPDNVIATQSSGMIFEEHNIVIRKGHGQNASYFDGLMLLRNFYVGTVFNVRVIVKQEF